MNIKDLRRWMEENDVKNRTLESFWVCLDNYLDEEKEEVVKYFGKFDKTRLSTVFYKTEVKIVNHDEIGSAEGDREFIESYLRLKYKSSDIGYYSLLFDFKGEVFDDFFVLDCKDWFAYKKLDVLNELRDDFNTNKLRKKYSQDLIDGINSLIDERIEWNKRNIRLYCDE